jgi:hypothetical protein
MPATDDQLMRAFYSAAIFLIDRVEHGGWYWTSNYLREHVRAATGLRFTNSRSPDILRKMVKHHPELTPWVALKPLTRPDRRLFDLFHQATDNRHAD